MIRHKKAETYAADSRHKGPKINKSSNLKPSSSTKYRKMDTRELKKIPKPDLSQLIEQKLFENNQLRRKLELKRERYRASHRTRIYIAAEAERIVKSLQQALKNFELLDKEIRAELPRH